MSLQMLHLKNYRKLAPMGHTPCTECQNLRRRVGGRIRIGIFLPNLFVLVLLVSSLFVVSLIHLIYRVCNI